MKKVLKGLLFAFVGVFALVLVASCGHEHKAKEGWKRDSSTHWHECEGCDEMLDSAIHDYGDWVVDVEADHANSKDGSRHRDCKVCGFRMKEAIKAMPVVYIRGSVNNWGNDWKADNDRDPWKLTISGSDETFTGLVLKTTDEFKIADLAWGTQFGASLLDDAAKEYFEGSDNIKVKVAGTYTITIKNVLNNPKISVVKTA